jgi:Domain of unknown function (DUF4350)
MRSDRIVRVLFVAALIALIVWIARHTYWDDVAVPTPMKGEAARNPYYSVEHLAASLGIRTQRISSLRALQPDAVVLVNNLNDDLLHESVESLQGWVESGGRLMVAGDVLWANNALQAWSGIKPASPAAPQPAPQFLPFKPYTDCVPMAVRVNGIDTGDSLRVCAPSAGFSLVSDRAPSWSLSDRQGMQVLRVAMGGGEFTVFGPRWILDNKILPAGDHAEILISSLGLERGDTLLILSPSQAEPLLALLWRLAAPAILFLAAAVTLLIVRYLPRFGPPLPVLAPYRRSLAEQIRANARFAWRTRKLESLRAILRRSLDAAAERCITGYGGLDIAQRADRLAASTGLDATAIGAALAEETPSKLTEHRAAMMLLEICRRILIKNRPTLKDPDDR